VTLEQLIDARGATFGPSAWITIDQARIDTFADVTLDHQWLHVDPERALRSTFGGTIAHGYLTLSLISGAHFELGLFPEDVTVLNYGLDRVRFTAPVPSGSRVRTSIVLSDVSERRAGRWLLRTASSVWLEGTKTPALSADALFLLLPG
jgi:acyl dehydratase